MILPKDMTEDEYHDHCNNNDGLCLGCGAIREGDTEPDAENYPCDECGKNMVVGIENALIMDMINID